MDAVLPLLCLLLGIALPASIAVVLVQRGWRQTAAPAAYRTVARQLSLEVDTRGASLNGYLLADRRRLYIGEVMVGHGRDRRFEHRGVLSFDRPLALGLAVRRRAGRRWFRRARGHEVSTQDSEFDKHFLVTGDDDEAVRGLLDEDIRTRISDLGRRYPDLLVTDHMVRVLLKRPMTDAGQLNDLVDGLRAFATAVGRARAALVPPPRLRDLVPNLGDLAAARQLTLDPAWPLLTGEVDGRAVEMSMRRVDDGYRGLVTGWFSIPTDNGFRLHRQVDPDGYWSVGQDIQVDDAAFDAAFVIKGYAPDSVRRRLSPVARRRLLALADLGEVEVDDHLVRVSGLPLDAAALGDALDRTTAVLAALEP